MNINLNLDTSTNPDSAQVYKKLVYIWAKEHCVQNNAAAKILWNEDGFREICQWLTDKGIPSSYKSFTAAFGDQTGRVPSANIICIEENHELTNLLLSL